MEKKKDDLSSLMSDLKSSTLQGFCAVDHDFLCLPQLMKKIWNMITMQVRSSRRWTELLYFGTFEMHHSVQTTLTLKL